METSEKVALTAIVTWIVGGLLLSGYFYHGPCKDATSDGKPQQVSCTFGLSLFWPLALPVNISMKAFAP